MSIDIFLIITLVDFRWTSFKEDLDPLSDII